MIFHCYWSIFTATNVLQYYVSQHNNTHSDTTAGRKEQIPELNCACKTRGLQSAHGRWQDRNVSSLAGLRGTVVGAFQTGFTVTMRTEVRANTPHRAGTSPSLALHPLTKRTRTFDWAAVWNLCAICTIKSTENYANNNIFLLLWPHTHSLLWHCHADLWEKMHLWTI